MNETNRSLIVLFCGILVMLMAVLIFLTWSANTDVIDALYDTVDYFNDHNDDPGRLIVTLIALIVAVMALLVIILELAPEDEEKELRVQQAGATTIVPAIALRERLEEALTALPDVTAARSRVKTKDDGIAVTMDVTVTPSANVAHVTQEANRVAVTTIQEDLGLPVKGTPVVRVSFGDAKAEAAATPMAQPPAPPLPPESPSAVQSTPVDVSQFQRPPAPPPASEAPRSAAQPESPQPPDGPPEGGEATDNPQS